jgi:hypothetical protein
MKKTFRFIIVIVALVISSAPLAGPFAITAYAEEKPVSETYNPDHQMAMNLSGKTTPVDAVIGAAEFLGFNPKSDTFTIVSETPSLSVVRVVHNGISFNVTLEPSMGGSWTVSSMNSSM